MGAAVGLLHKAGLVDRAPSTDDERSVTLTLTASGRALLHQVLPGHIDVVRHQMLDPLTARDLSTLTNILGRVRDRMRAAPPRSAAPRPGHQRAPAER